MEPSSDDILAQLEAQFDEVDISDVLDVSTMETTDIIEMIADLDQELFSSGQAMNPTTSEARDKHSLRNALTVEYRKRTWDAS
jgi:hypothetical protein